jgi:ureidoacrylate peracid hydrolase
MIVSFEELYPKETALLFFDLLNAYYRGAGEETQRRKEPMVRNCVEIMEIARSAGIPVFYANADHRADGREAAFLYTDTDMRLQPWANPEVPHTRNHGHMASGTWNSEVIAELRPQPGDYIVPKHRWSAFYQTSLELSLRARGIKTILLCGGATDIGVASTVFAARDMDFNLVIISDACDSSQQDSHHQLLKRIFPRMARVRTTEQVIQMIEHGARAG